MAAKLKRIFSLYALYARMDLHWFTQDTFVCALCVVSDILANLAAVSGVFLLSVRFAGVGGLSADEVLFMLGFYTLADGCTLLFSGFNTSHISRRIGRGQVDHMLIQPLPLWMQLMTGGFIPVSGSSGLFMGVILTAIAAARLGLAMTPGRLLLLLLLAVMRMAVVLGFNFLFATRAFYKPAANEEISFLTNDLFTTLGKYPLAGLPAWVQTALVSVFPVGLMAWLPALVLLGKTAALPALILPLGGIAALLAITTRTFKRGLAHYVKQGCNRYRDMGHRN